MSIEPAQMQLHLAFVARLKLSDLQLNAYQPAQIPMKEETADGLGFALHSRPAWGLDGLVQTAWSSMTGRMLESPQGACS
jgi:hypothetical protein